jgi:hypothetical protein
MMPTALVIIPGTPDTSGVFVGMAYAALSDIGLTSEENPLKNISFKTPPEDDFL